MKNWVTWGGASVVGAVGAAAAFFLDPKSGAKRRQAAVEKGTTIVRRERAQVSAMIAGATGKTKKTKSRKASAIAPDELVAAQVREALHDRHAELAGAVGVRVSRGRVTLRGEVPDIELIGTLARSIEKVSGVREVNNLLRLESRS